MRQKGEEKQGQQDGKGGFDFDNDYDGFEEDDVVADLHKRRSQTWDHRARPKRRSQTFDAGL